MYEHLDVTDPDAGVSVVDAVVARWARLDILINNAGVGYGAVIDVLPLEQHHRLVDVNLNGVYYGVRAVAQTI